MLLLLWAHTTSALCIDIGALSDKQLYYILVAIHCRTVQGWIAILVCCIDIGTVDYKKFNHISKPCYGRHLQGRPAILGFYIDIGAFGDK